MSRPEASPRPGVDRISITAFIGEVGTGPSHLYPASLTVYLIETADPTQLPAEEEGDLCCLCRGENCDGMLECSRCLGGYHMKCLKPKVKEVPKVGGSVKCPVVV